MPTVIIQPSEPPSEGSDKDLLLGFLHYQQQIFLRKVQSADGGLLSQQQLTTALHPTSMTLAGMIGHLWFVQDYWRETILLGNPLPPPWDTCPWEANPDADWCLNLPAHTALENLRNSITSTEQELLAVDSWDTPGLGLRPDGREVSYRWVALHLIEEWARHLGHADLLRENIDGQTGD